MQTISHIVFPTDFSSTAQHAFKHCLRVADRFGASIHLMHVAYPEYDVMDMPIVSAQITKQKTDIARTLMTEFSDKVLSTLPASTLQHASRMTSSVEIGTPVDAIIRVAEDEEADLVMMGTRGEHDILDQAFGSVATGLIARSGIPVWVIPEAAPVKDFAKVVYASDLQDNDPNRILRLMDLLAPLKANFYCVHVNREGRLAERLDFSDLSNYFKIRDREEGIAFHEIAGDSVVESLEDFVQKSEVDLLIMYSPQYNWLERIFHRSQTRKIAMSTEVPLLVVKR